LLRQIENGFEIAGLLIQAPPGLREVGLAFVMLVILIFRPHGLTGGKELPAPRLLRGASG
jgi:branched-chain amino acid transport system permease protein